MTFSVFIKRQAQKSLAKIPLESQQKIINKIDALIDRPYPHGCKKLSGRDAWRIRIGHYRVIYEVDGSKLIILVIEIGHRKEIYRKS